MRYGEGKLSCTVLKTNGIGDNLVEFNTKPNKPTGYKRDIYKCDCIAFSTGSREAFPCHLYYILLNKTTDTFKNQHKTKNKC
ncbi:hypothetical protein ASL19_14645 [Cylindrospermopsis sp. CR12]|nr:hypothetical protein ASL19_14645 [Cylindrospermopsis sp. CR12]